MQELIAGLEKLVFDLERDVALQRGALLLPFPGMDKSGASVCEFFLRGLCAKAAGSRRWCASTGCVDCARGGTSANSCMSTMSPRCPSAISTPSLQVPVAPGKMGIPCRSCRLPPSAAEPVPCRGECSNRECPFLHIDPASRIKDCPWYNRGFCKQGPLCKYKHTRRVMCVNYLAGFCPEGPKCKFMHPKADVTLCNSDLSQGRPGKAPMWASPEGLTPPAAVGKRGQEPQALEVPSLSHQPGVKAAPCQMKKAQETGGYPYTVLRPLGQVTCFKCGEKGHYANKCRKSRLGIQPGK
ncbi:putative cleavage and polyadenylation specificity factor subunit 4-like protein isoform X3 [Pelodiscus sinensis]|uniref:putative cleavage and polyadenylation specificity factor subunit 4-like protein isoform X3 n=1 Tax=Pelodiscus sinensis TaxID=13735 RepID=UPI003F6A9776